MWADVHMWADVNNIDAANVTGNLIVTECKIGVFFKKK